MAAFGLRTAGVALLAAWAAESLLRRRLRQAVARGGRRWRASAPGRCTSRGVKSDPAFAEPAYPYQRADYQFYNVGYVENMSYMDPFRPELGRASARQLAARVWTNVRGMPLSLGEAATLHRGWLVGEVSRVRERFPRARDPRTGPSRPRWCS